LDSVEKLKHTTRMHPNLFGCGGVPDNYPTIQAAVNVADPGDTIIVRDGIYTGNVNVNKRLTIQSEKGMASTIVQAGSADGFFVTADHVNISGFTVKCGTLRSGIDLHSAHHCNISNNNVSNNYAAKGVYLVQSSNNVLASNIISNNWRGIYLDSSSNNLLTNNNASNSHVGIRVTFSNNNNITNNTVKSNTDIGIWMGYSSNNTLKNNIISENGYNFGVMGDSPSEYVHNIDTSNTINGKPIYYWINRQDQEIPNDAGFVEIVNSINITVSDLTLTDNYEGVLFANTKNSRIENVTVSNSRYGIYFSHSGNNTIKNNTASSNSWDGIHLSYSSNNTVTNNTANSKNATYGKGISLYFSSNNAIYLNNFLNNNQNAYSENSTNFWNSTEEITYIYRGSTHKNYLGNYWSDYTEIDTDTNGIGDTAYSIDGDKDNYPLMWHWENYFAPPEKQPPTASFTYAPKYPVVNQSITFDASLSYDPEGFITNYEWGFGDGNITNTTEKIITYSYALKGDYTVNLTVTDNDGLMNSTSKRVTVLKLSPPEEEWNKTFGGLGSDDAYSVQHTTDGGYILAGRTKSYGAGNYDFWMVKTDSSGDKEWYQIFGGPSMEGEGSSALVDNSYIIAGYTNSYGAGSSDVWLIKLKGEQTISIFDTEPSEDPYSSIMGTHNGTITPSSNINVSTLYTYACAGTGGHTESIKLYENGELIASGTWEGYRDDWHNITITPSVTLLAGHTYNYTIVTGSYPQIIHAKSKDVTGGTITCISFVDANGKAYTDWIPAIRLE
jgi:parallel beta-helix repeat protein